MAITAEQVKTFWDNKPAKTARDLAIFLSQYNLEPPKIEWSQLSLTEQIKGTMVSKETAKVILIGESEFPECNLRELISEIISTIVSDNTDTVCALEWMKADQPILSKFQDTGNINELANSATRYDRFYDINGALDSGYSSILNTCKNENIQLRAIDETRGTSYKNRDLFMAQEINNILESGTKRVIVVGGSNHHFIRPEAFQGRHKTISENLIDLGINKQNICTMLGLVKKDKNTRYHVMANTISALPSAEILSRHDHNWLEEVHAGIQGRCGYGVCGSINTSDLDDSFVFTPCVQCKTTLAEAMMRGMDPIYFDYWDYILLSP